MNLKKHLEDYPSILEAMQPYLTPAKDEEEIDNLIKELEEKGIPNLSDDEIDQLKDLRKSKGLSIDDLEMDRDQLADMESLNNFAAEIDKKDEKPEGTED